MMRLSAELLIASASLFVDSRPGVSAATIERLRREAGSSGQGAWDAALVYHWGYWSHFEPHTARSAWPVAATCNANALAMFGEANGVLRVEAAAGDIFLQYSPAQQRFVRAGVVADVRGRGWYARDEPYFDVLSIEGNTDERGDLGGSKAMRVARRLWPAIGDRFLNWPGLDRDAVVDTAGQRLTAIASVSDCEVFG